MVFADGRFRKTIRLQPPSCRKQLSDRDIFIHLIVRIELVDKLDTPIGCQALSRLIMAILRTHE
jgi:hypothetical protein